MPEGFAYYPDFINEQEELNLIGVISGLQLHSFKFQGYEAKRKVASYGYDWSFDTRRLSRGKEIPGAFNSIIETVAGKINVSKTSFAELLVTEYPVASVINWHRDAPPFDIIAGLSLASDCIFKLRPYDKAKQKRNAVISIPLKRRSLYMISGESRTEWEHSIAPVKQIRYSITLRTLRAAPLTK